jgi:branched-chain amino acid transport system permease protein
MAAEAWQFILAGLVVGGIFALIAAGFVMIYQVAGIINFAQGEFAMIGAMTAASLHAAGWPTAAAAAAAVLTAAAVGGLVQWAAIRPARGSGTVTLIFITLGLDVAIRGGALFVWGTNPLLLPAFAGGTSIAVGPGTIPPQALFVFGADGLVVLALYVFFRRTYLGAAVRAATANPTIARVFGMPLAAFSFWSFVAAAAIGALGGVVIAPITSATYDMGLYLGLNGFVAAILGGLDSLPGALLGGFLLGIIEKLSGGFISTGWEQGIAFIILIAVLIGRPQGLLGHRVRRA